MKNIPRGKQKPKITDLSERFAMLEKSGKGNVVTFPARPKTAAAPILPADKNNIIPFPPKKTYSARLNDDALLGLGDLKRGAIVEFQAVFNTSAITPETLCCVFVKKFNGCHCGFLTIKGQNVELGVANPAYETLYYSLSEIEIKGIAVDRSLNKSSRGKRRN
jgi:hypothetical protein